MSQSIKKAFYVLRLAAPDRSDICYFNMNGKCCSLQNTVIFETPEEAFSIVNNGHSHYDVIKVVIEEVSRVSQNVSYTETILGG